MWRSNFSVGYLYTYNILVTFRKKDLYFKGVPFRITCEDYIHNIWYTLVCYIFKSESD